jgi:phage gp29-like protein
VPPAAITQRYVSHPIQPPIQVDEVRHVDSILRELEYGNFRSAALLVDAMGRDDRIEGVLSTRVGALKSAPIDVLAADESRKAKKLAEQLGGVADVPGEWDQIFPAAITGELVRYGFMLGIAVAEKVWKLEAGAWTPRLRCWHPQFLRWDWSRGCYLLWTADRGEIEMPRLDEDPHGNPQWFLFCPYGYQYSWLRGAVRALGRKYIARQWNDADWSGYNEAHGHPIKKAIHPFDGPKDDHDAFVQDVANSRSQTTVGVPQSGSEDGSKYDVELVEPTSRSWETFKAFIEAANVDIAVLILGQNLTTEVQGGSLAAAGMHNIVRLDKAAEDASIAPAYRDQVLWWRAEFNQGDGKLAPRPVIRVRPPEDKLAKASALGALATALATFKAAASPVDERMILEDAAVPTLSEEEIAAQQAVEAEEEGADESEPGAGGEADDPDEKDDDEKEEGEAALSATPLIAKRYTFAGLPIAIENPVGTIRIWRGPEGQIGSTRMAHDYGFIEGHLSGDDEELDVYIGPDENAREVYVVHQLKLPHYKGHDEDKVFLGFPSADAARAAYVAHRNDGDRAISGMSVMPLEVFKRKLKRRSGTGKIRASAAHARTVTALLRLAERDPEVAALRAGPGKPKRTKYPDRLTTNGTQLAARALAVDLVTVRNVIDRVGSLEELREKLAVAFRGMDPTRLAEVFQKTRLMAVFAGRTSAAAQVNPKGKRR